MRCSRCRMPASRAATTDVEVMTDLVGAGRAGRRAARPRRRRASEARMRFVDEYRDAELGRALAAQILATVEPGRHYKVMEVCGGHTHTIYKYGVDDLLPENVELVHGPGCPVCVIPMGRVDDGIAVAHERERDLHLLRRHDARARRRRDAARGEGRGRRRPDGLLAARRAAASHARTRTARSSSSRSASRPRRRRPR